MPAGEPPMSEEERRLRTRFGIAGILAGVLMMANGLWSIWSIHARGVNQGVLEQLQTEIDSRLAATKTVLTETEHLNQQASELNGRAAKIEATLRDAKNQKK
ncbi:MAG TPA: hypothetical protein VH107_17610 [Lacipirellulaceae bacterium]|nr:hypothetical protein [Lacipirellulaceae bacterium]